MKKLLLILNFLILFQLNFAYETELKLGYESYRKYKDKENQGFSIGLERLKSGKDSHFTYGFGSELKTGINSVDIIAPIYFTIKQDAGINKSFYLVGRGGGIIYNGDSSNIGLYLAGGIGKQINNFTFETLYEFNDLDSKSLNIVSFKIGYKFGGTKKAEKVSLDEEKKMKNQYEKQEQELLEKINVEKINKDSKIEPVPKKGTQIINDDFKNLNKPKIAVAQQEKIENKDRSTQSTKEVKINNIDKINSIEVVENKKIEPTKPMDKTLEKDVDDYIQKLTKDSKNVKLPEDNSNKTNGKNNWLWWLIIPLAVILRRVTKK